jgi:hypothetical protein
MQKKFFERIRHCRQISTIEDMFILLAISLASIWKLLGSSDIIMQLDLIFPSNMNQYLTLSTQSWNPLLNLGTPNTNAENPLALGFSFLNTIGLTPGQIERVLLVGVIFTAGMSMYFLSKYLSSGKRFVAFISAIVYMFNPFVIDNLLWGQVYLQAAYSLVPLVLLFFIISLDRFSLRFAALTGVLLALVTSLQIQFGYVSLMLLVFWIIAFFYREIKSKHNLQHTMRSIVKSLFTLLISGIFAAVSKLYLVIPAFFGSLTSGYQLHATTFWFETIANASNVIGGLQNTIRLRYRLYSFYQQFEDSALQTWHIPRELLLFITTLFVIMVFASVLFRKKSRAVIWFALIILLFVYLSAGTNTPINVFNWLFQNVPYFFIFREPSKFFIVIALGFSYLFGVTSFEIYSFLSKRKIHICKINSKHNPIQISPAKPLIILLLFVVLWPNMFPVVQGDFGGMHNIDFPAGYENTYNWLESRPDDFKVLVLPLSMLGHWAAPQLPSHWIENAYAGLTFYNSPPKPIIIQPSAIFMNQGSQRITYYLENLIYTGQVDRLASLLSALGVKYVVVAPMNDNSPFDIYTQTPGEALKLLQTAPFLRLSYSSEDFYVFENLKFGGQTYLTDTSYLAFGNLGLLSTESQVGLPTLIYGYNLPSSTVSSVASTVKGIVFQGNRFTDYVLQSIDDQYFTTLTPYVSIRENNASKAWVLASAYPRPVSDVYALGEVYNPDGFVYTTGSNISLTAPNKIKEDSEQQIWVRALQGPNAGVLQIAAGSEEFPATSLYSQQLRGLQWQLIGSTKKGTEMQALTVNSLNGTNIIDRLAIIPEGVFNESYEKTVNSVKATGLIFDIDPVSFDTISGWESEVNVPTKLEFNALVESKAVYSEGLLAVTITNNQNSTIPYGFNIFVNGANRYTEFMLGPPLKPNQSITKYYGAETLQKSGLVLKTGDSIQVEPFWDVNTSGVFTFNSKEAFPLSPTYRLGEKSSTWPVASLNLTTPYSSNFDLSIDAKSVEGTGKLNVIVDNIFFSTILSSSTSESTASIKLGTIKLDKGIHTISVVVDTSSKANIEFYSIRLIDSSQSSRSKHLLEVNPVFDSFTHATVNVSTSKPVVIVYSESYDLGWELRMKNGNEMLHLEINGFANGWLLQNATDNIEQTLDLSFSSQRLLDISLLTRNILAAAVIGISIFIYFRISIKEKIEALKSRFIHLTSKI